MQGPPPFGDDVIRGALRRDRGLQPDELSYTRVGYGSWHWNVRAAPYGRLFVTVDDNASGQKREELEWAYRVPLALVQRGLPFARAPIPTPSGAVLASVDATWVVSVWPFLEGRSTHDGTYSTGHEAAAVLEILGILHQLPTGLIGEPEPRAESFQIAGLDRLLELVDRAWAGPHVGPHAAAAEELLHRHAGDIRGLASLYADLVRCAPPEDEWVITHGEPHAANVVFTSHQPVLIDWDTAKVAPKERDLWMIATDGFPIGAAERDMLRLYRAQWDLRELADYASRFADSDDDGPEGEPAWNDFAQYVYRAAHI